MSTRLFVMVSKKVAPRKYFSNGAACGLKVEIPSTALEDPAAFVKQIRGHMELCELAVAEELAKLDAATPKQTVIESETNGPAERLTPPAARPAPPARRLDPPPAIPPVGPAEAWDESERPIDDEPDEDAPTDGRQLLGWARKQDRDMKSWIISLGYKRKFKGNVVDWTEAQVATAYAAAKRELANPAPARKR